jgi:MFS family permease
LSAIERRAALSLAGIFALRMLGLFLILPVFALYAEGMPGVTPVLIGLAVGAYGLTQALLQIPFGMLSDRIGRKPVIVGGLIVFAAGSLVAATSETIYGVIFGRALQGSGAIAAAVMALAADLTREEVRTRAMAMIGVSIGAAFALALVLGPVLDHWIGVPGIFWLTALLAVSGVLIVIFLVPTPPHPRVHRDAEPTRGQLRGVLVNPELLRLDFGVLTLHMLMTALFLVFPLSLVANGVDSARHWLIYLPVMLLSMLAMVPFVIIAEKRHRMRGVFLGAVLILALAQLVFWWGAQSLAILLLALFLYFTAFNVLEASLPSLISKIAPAQAKGSAMGVFSSSQFAGAFLGGLLGGWAHQALGIDGVYLLCGGLALLWFGVGFGMADPGHLRSQLIHLGDVAEQEVAGLQTRLLGVPGVKEAVVIAEEGVAYLKVDSQHLDWAKLEKFSAAEA